MKTRSPADRPQTARIPSARTPSVRILQAPRLPFAAHPAIRRIPVPLRVVLSLVVMALIGSLLLRLPGVSYRPLTYGEALFTSVSAITVTGLSVIDPAVDLTPFGKVVLAGLIQLGGIGALTLTVLVFRLLGRRISLLERIALRNTLGHVDARNVLGLAGWVILGVFIIEGLGALLLWLHWRQDLVPILGSDLKAFSFAAFHSMSAFCNAGFEIFGSLPGMGNNIPTDAASLALLAGLITTGGLGVPVIADLLALRKKHRLSLNTRLTLAIYFSLVLLGGLGMFFAEGLAGRLAPGLRWYEWLGMSFFQSVSARTGGLTGSLGFEALTPASRFLVVMLMFVGAAPASMGGGITTGTAAVLGLAMWAYAGNRADPTIAGRTVARASIQRATAVLILSLLVVLVATWLLLLTHPHVPVIDALFEVVSAFATCGLTLAFTGQLNPFGRVIIMLVMIWGRLGALTVVVALSRPAPPRLIHYPDENLLIG